MSAQLPLSTEHITIDGPLTVEHLLPQIWITHWPLPDGTKGLDGIELLFADHDNPTANATKNRNNLLHTFGNLTIITQPLNTSLSNAPWNERKPALLRASLLPINQELTTLDHWNEASITTRSQELLKRALQLWPRPTT